jgi:hypothetical protein
VVPHNSQLEGCYTYIIHVCNAINHKFKASIKSDCEKSASVIKVDWLEQVAEWESRRRRTCLLLAAAALISHYACMRRLWLGSPFAERPGERDRPAGRRAPCSSISMREREREIIKLCAQSQRATHIYVHVDVCVALQKNYKSSFSFFRTRTTAEYWKARCSIIYIQVLLNTHAQIYTQRSAWVTYLRAISMCICGLSLCACCLANSSFSLRLLTMRMTSRGHICISD